MRVWDVHTGKLGHTLTGHTEEIECLRVCGDTIALSGSWDHSLRIWDTLAGICTHTLLRHSEGVLYTVLYVSMLSQPTKLSNLASVNPHLYGVVFMLCCRVVFFLLFCAVVSCCEGEWNAGEGKGRVVSGGGDGLVKLWDLRDGREILSMAGHTAEVVCVCACVLHLVH